MHLFKIPLKHGLQHSIPQGSFVISMLESFEITISGESYRIIQSKINPSVFSVFNHATCHIIKKDQSKWLAVEHKFGAEYLPVELIGTMIDNYFAQLRNGNGSVSLTGTA